MESENVTQQSSSEYVHETDESLHMYLRLHNPASGAVEEVPPILPHSNAPDHAIRFPQRVAQLLKTLQPKRTNNCALDIGCAVGGSSFELAKSYDHVDAFDHSSSFISSAKRMQKGDNVMFKIPIEADLYETVKAMHEVGVTPHIRSKVSFSQEMPVRLPT